MAPKKIIYAAEKIGNKIVLVSSGSIEFGMGIHLNTQFVSIPYVQEVVTQFI